jgi:hypothetical protein
MIQQFSEGLAQTAVSRAIQETSWIIPGVQTVHILAIAVVMSSIAMIDARLVGFGAMARPVSAIAHRYLPWVWSGVLILLASGSILIIGEPKRELLSAVFWIKMSLLVCALILTAVFQRPLNQQAYYWDQRKTAARALGVISLLLWLGILSAGRLIAYFEHG